MWAMAAQTLLMTDAIMQPVQLHRTVAFIARDDGILDVRSMTRRAKPFHGGHVIQNDGPLAFQMTTQAIAPPGFEVDFGG